jgi:hypothetical protein
VTRNPRGGEPDQVPRLRAFRDAHPEYEIRSPEDNRSPHWSAYLNGAMVAADTDLRFLLDALEWLAARLQIA